MEKIKLGPDHYRYVDELDPKGLEVTCKKYVVIGETDQCWYIVEEFHNNLFGGPHRESMLKQYRKRVLKEGGEHGRRFAYTDKSLALRSYKQRKSWQMRHAELALERAKAAIGYFGDARIENTVPSDVLVVPCEYIQAMNWSEC
ncbi:MULTISPECIES: hypothetical protein [Pseudomonas]|uniref:Uncharacterized protein n=1 Tax=Pseudomonas rhodesiae TaxID=76760 RepID=A0A8I1E4J0_9PSED|nr:MULTISPECIES: hypothetical protein [Pseudomonas]MBI6600602.1 hypothetical protein [Pseudomonas sp. S4_EA_1b]MBI6625345.1 hypothetical protein [Pseudomonas rhodesiae]